MTCSREAGFPSDGSCKVSVKEESEYVGANGADVKGTDANEEEACCADSVSQRESRMRKNRPKSRAPTEQEK